MSPRSDRSTTTGIVVCRRIELVELGVDHRSADRRRYSVDDDRLSHRLLESDSTEERQTVPEGRARRVQFDFDHILVFVRTVCLA